VQRPCDPAPTAVLDGRGWCRIDRNRRRRSSPTPRTCSLLRWAVNLVAPLTRVRVPPIIVHLPAISEPASDVKSRGPLPSLCTRLGRRSANGSFRRPLRLPNDASSRDRRRMNVLHASVEPPRAFAGLTEAGMLHAGRARLSMASGVTAVGVTQLHFAAPSLLLGRTGLLRPSKSEGVKGWEN
jgi:hypothetical protein